MFYDYSQEERQAIAESFVYGCLNDINKAPEGDRTSTFVFFYGRDEFAKYYTSSREIKQLAREENLTVKFEITEKNEYKILVSLH